MIHKLFCYFPPYSFFCEYSFKNPSIWKYIIITEHGVCL
jgi:hypothetical protein